MEKNFICFFSNSLRKLAELLGENLLQSSPFGKKWVVVSDHAMKTFLMESFAGSSYGISCGVPVITLRQAEELLLENDPKMCGRHLPSTIELSCRIESILREIFSRWRDFAHKDVFSPLLNYFDLEGPSNLQRLPGFCDALAKAFVEHGTWGGKLQEAWQEFLLHEVFKDKWITPSELFSSLASTDSFYLFHTGILPPAHVDFFKRSDAVFYGLSPCQHFWGDVHSDDERVFLLKKFEGREIKLKEQEEWNTYVGNEHRLLSNLGKVGKKVFQTIQENSLSYEFYEPFLEGPLGILHSLQRSILNFSDSKERQPALFDGSIQVHVAPSVFRELEICKQVISEIVDQTDPSKEKVQLDEIVVMAPDIGQYLPYLDRIFGEKEPLLPYEYESTAKEQSCLFEGVNTLLHMMESGMDKKGLLVLFENARFLEKLSVETKAAQDLRYLLEEMHLPANDWNYGILQLLTGFMTSRSEKSFLIGKNAIAPIQVKEDKGDLLVKLIRAVDSIEADVLASGKERTINEWCQFFISLLRNYFSLKEEEERIIEGAHSFCYAMKEESILIPFSSARRVFSSFLHASGKRFFSSERNCIRFSNFDYGKFSHAKVIYLLGMDEGSFPRKESKNPFTLSEKKAPSRSDLDRYLFLEALISAQQYFVMSYQRFSSGDHKEQKSSFVLQELLLQLDRGFNLESEKPLSLECTKVHPSLALDPLYFSSNSSLFSYSKQDCENALAAFSSPPKKAPFLNFEAPKKMIEEDQHLEIDVKQLKELARHPIRFYFQEKLGLVLKEVPKNEEFRLSNFDRSYLYREMEKKPVEEIISYAKLKGMLPEGFPGMLAEKQMREDAKGYMQHLAKLHMTKDDVCTYILQKGCKAPVLSEAGVWLVPPLEIAIENNVHCVIAGELSGVTPRGLLVGKEAAFESTVKVLPEYLIYCNHPAFKENEKQLLFYGEDLKKSSFDADESMLRCFLEYFLMAKNYLSPCMPRWIEPLVQQDEHSLSKEMIKSMEEQVWEDSYLLFLKNRAGRFSSKDLCQMWSEHAKGIFSDLLEVTYETV